jgi:hypothetical protein
MRGAFFVRGATALTGDLTLLFGRHRSKTASFFAHSVHRHPPRCSETPKAIATGRNALAMSNRGGEGYKADASPAEKSG